MATDLATTVSRWVSGAQGAQQKFVDGVRNTTSDPTQLAIAAESSLLSGFQQAVSSGRWRQNLARVGKAGWQQATVDKANNYGTGISAGQDKFSAAMQTWLPVIQQTAAQVRSMPSGSIAASNARSAAFATALYNRKRGL